MFTICSDHLTIPPVSGVGNKIMRILPIKKQARAVFCSLVKPTLQTDFDRLETGRGSGGRWGGPGEVGEAWGKRGEL